MWGEGQEWRLGEGIVVCLKEEGYSRMWEEGQEWGFGEGKEERQQEGG